MTRARPLAFLFGGIALILVILALQLINPGEKTLRETIRDATITFTADRRMVAAPGSCVTVHWQVEHIQAVYINGEPTVGESERDTCVTETTMPVLHVDFADGEASDYRLNIDFLIFQPSTWLLVSAALLLGLASLYVAVSHCASAVPAEQPTGRKTPRIARVFTAIGLIVVGVGVTTLMLELMLCFYFNQFGSQDEKIAYLYTRSQIEALQSQVIPLPFVEYGLTPGYVSQNQLGYRGSEIDIPKPPGVYRIVALGGSTTYGTTTPPDATYPYLLQQELRNNYGRSNVEVINGGVAGYTTWNTFVTLALRVTMLEPDLVIMYDGANDILPREASPDCYSAPSPFLGLDPRRALRAAPEPMSPSVLYRFVAINLSWIPNPSTLVGLTISSPVGCDESGAANFAHNVEVNRPTYFERNERNSVAIAKANGFQILFVTWPYDHNSPEALPFWRTAVDEHNSISVKIAQEEGALYFDYAAVAPVNDDSYWSDYIHMNGKGSLNEAHAIAKFLIDHGIIDGQTH